MGKIQRNATKVKMPLTYSDSKGKRKRWAKGHSSDSNPMTRIYRDSAKNRFYHPQNSEEGLKIRDMKMLENMDLNLNGPDEDGASAADTVCTRLSNITNCTNPTFDKVHRIWKSGSKLHTDVLTVLASATDMIKSKGGKETEVEYFAALLHPLSDPEYSDNHIAATCYLLSLVIRKVSKPILIQQFHRVADIIYSLLVRFSTMSEDSDDVNGHRPAILRYSLSSLGYLLEIHPSSVWSASPYKMFMLKMLESILEFVVHEKPRVRKTAQKTIAQIFLNSVSVPAVVSERCSEFCVQQMERYGGGGRGKEANSDNTLHVLTLLQYILHRFSSGHLKQTVETIFKLLALGSNLITTTAIHCLYMMFKNRPTADSVSSDLNTKIIGAIYDFQPSSKDGRSCANWIQLITEAHGCLIERDLDTGAEYTPKLLETIAKCLTNSEHIEVTTAAVGSMKRILGDFVLDLAKSPPRMESLAKCLEILEKLLSAQYYAVWPHVFSFFSAFYESAGSSSCVGLKNYKRSLKSIAELRENPSFPCKLLAEQAIGAAVRHVGVEDVLEAIPLGLHVNLPSQFLLDFPRSWLLPVLRMNIVGAKLAYFASYFLPLAIKIDQRAKELRAIPEKETEWKVLETVECQMWELLPAFCKKPVDVLDPVTARAFGAALIGRPKLRISILCGIRRLLQEENNDEVKRTMVKYGGNYLNILLQLYTMEEGDGVVDADCNDEGARLATLHTIRTYLPVLSDDSVGSYGKELCKRLKLANEAEKMQQKCRLMDILVLLVPQSNLEQRWAIYELLTETMATAEKRTLKKCWRLMEQLCNGESEAGKKFVTTNLPLLQTQLQSDLTNAAPSTKACRLRCLTLLLETLKENATFILAVLPDAVLCLHGTSVKAKKYAAKFIVKTVTVMGQWKKDINEGLKMVFHTVMAAIDRASSKEGKRGIQEATGAIIAARLLCYEFRNDISADLVSSMLGTICHLLSHDSRRPVVQSCLEFLKTFVGSFSEITVGQFLDTIISAICNQNEESKQHCRMLTRKVLAKLVKRFSYVTIKKYVPEIYEKQLNNIRKLVARSEKRTAAVEEKKKGKCGGSVVSGISDETGSVLTSFTNLSRPETIADLLKDSSDEDELSEDEEERKRKRGKKTPSVWLKEGDEEEIVDLMDKKVVQQIVATKPKSSAPDDAPSVTMEKKKNRGFKTAPDGRLVITMEKDEEEEMEKGRKRRRVNSVESVEEEMVRKVKRVHFDDEVEEEEEQASTYVPGGKGIHRRVQEGKKNGKKGKEEKKKNKKAIDPYSYVPMNKKTMGKRKKTKMGGELKHLVQGAKKGATKGAKGRKKIKVK